MSVFSVCGIGFVCICASVIVRENGYRNYSVIVSCLCAAVILVYSVSRLSGSYDGIRMILNSNSNIKYIDVVAKSFGTAFVCEVCSDFIRELGSDSIAKSIETAGKAEIMLLCIQPIGEILNTALSLAGQA